MPVLTGVPGGVVAKGLPSPAGESSPAMGRRVRPRRVVVPIIAVGVVVLGFFGALTLFEGTNSVRSAVSTVEAMFETYNEEGPHAALQHFSTDVADRFDAHMSGLAVWNDRLEVLEPCTEISGGSIVCVMWEQHDFHKAAGLPPFTNQFTFRVTEGEISYISQDVHVDVLGPDQDSEIRRHGVGLAPLRKGRTDFVPYFALYSRYRIWLANNYPQEAARIGSFPGYHGLNPNFDATSAAAILEFIDEFVAQSNDYPPLPLD